MFFKIDKINTFFFKNMQPYCVLLHLVVKTLRAKIFSRLISCITPKNQQDYAKTITQHLISCAVIMQHPTPICTKLQ
jgi:hypothetical protein